MDLLFISNMMSMAFPSDHNEEESNSVVTFIALLVLLLLLFEYLLHL